MTEEKENIMIEFGQSAHYVRVDKVILVRETGMNILTLEDKFVASVPKNGLIRIIGETSNIKFIEY